jgi:Predicted Zn-dependent hydrolases of the beta-lactamase fold
MKITWFGQSALRIHLGGQVVVIDAGQANAGVDQGELRSGADIVLALDDPQPKVDGSTWKPRPAQRLLEAGEQTRPVDMWSPGQRSVLIDPDEDMPLLVAGGPVPALGRWIERTVVLMVGSDLAERAQALLAGGAPRLLALAAEEREVDAAIGAIRDRLDGTGVVALEPGLAVEA